MEGLIRGTAAYKILSGDADKDRLSHAYMLHFPDPRNTVGALKLFALVIFGADADSATGRRIMNGSYPDFKIYPADGKKLTADAVAEILDDCALRPVEGKRKLYAVSAFESASALLQNKLLKTLEEPPAGVHFLLGATSLAPVLDTVKSRVKLLEIPPFSEREIYDALERRGRSELNAAAAKSANGILGAAENMVEGGWFKEVLTAAEEICGVTEVGKIGITAAKYGDIKYKNELLGEMQRIYFDALAGGGRSPLSPHALVFALERLVAAFADVKFNAFFQGLLYDFMLEVVRENEKWQKL